MTESPLCAVDPSSPSGDDKAVQEQLGLRLEPATDAVDAFIIDSVEPPTPN